MFALVLAACGGDENPTAAETKKKPAAAMGEACAAAKEKITSLETPVQADGLGDYADQAATALEKAGRKQAAAHLRDAELAGIEERVPALNAAIVRVRDVAGDCGELEAADALAFTAYAWGLEDAIKAVNRLYRRVGKLPDQISALRADARRMRLLAAHLEKLAPPTEVREEHERYLKYVKEYGRRSTLAAKGQSSPPEVDGTGDRRDKALRTLNHELDKLIPRD